MQLLFAVIEALTKAAQASEESSFKKCLCSFLRVYIQFCRLIPIFLRKPFQIMMMKYYSKEIFLVITKTSVCPLLTMCQR